MRHRWFLRSAFQVVGDFDPISLSQAQYPQTAYSIFVNNLKTYSSTTQPIAMMENVVSWIKGITPLFN